MPGTGELEPALDPALEPEALAPEPEVDETPDDEPLPPSSAGCTASDAVHASGVPAARASLSVQTWQRLRRHRAPYFPSVAPLLGRTHRSRLFLDDMAPSRSLQAFIVQGAAGLGPLWRQCQQSLPPRQLALGSARAHMPCRSARLSGLMMAPLPSLKLHGAVVAATGLTRRRKVARPVSVEDSADRRCDASHCGPGSARIAQSQMCDVKPRAASQPRQRPASRGPWRSDGLSRASHPIRYALMFALSRLDALDHRQCRKSANS